MPRLARRSAGNRVLARAQSLSDDLLVAEEVCFARIEDALTAAAPKAQGLLDAGWRKAKNDVAALARDGNLQADLYAEHATAITSTRVSVSLLAADSVARSLAAISDELGWCEETLAARYAGVAALGLVHANTVAVGLVETVMSTHLLAEVAALLWFADQTRDSLLMAAASKDDLSVVSGRLLSKEPFRARGAGGRGIWFRTGSELNASARGVSITLMNQTRQAAMAGMNEAGRAR